MFAQNNSNRNLGAIGTKAAWYEKLGAARGTGTAAEYTAIAAENAVPLPDHVSFETGATLGVVAFTAHWALFRDGPVAGQTIFVPGGAGSVGSAAIQLARWGGASAIVVSVSRPEQAAVARPPAPIMSSTASASPSPSACWR